MVEALIVISVVLSWVIAYSLGYENGKVKEQEIARQFLDVIAGILEGTIEPEEKRDRPVGSKNKPKA